MVLITALDDAGTSERLKRSRAITVLQKPFADHALFAAIERGLAASLALPTQTNCPGTELGFPPTG